MQAWKSFSEFEPGTNCRAWLFKISVPLRASRAAEKPVQRFAIAGFGTPAFLVYLVSDTGEAENTQMMAAMAPPLRDFLNRP